MLVPASLACLVGADAIQTRFEQLAYATTESADVLSPGAVIPHDVLKAARPLDTEVLARGTRIRILDQEAIRNHTPTAAYARDLAALGGPPRPHRPHPRSSLRHRPRHHHLPPTPLRLRLAPQRTPRPRHLHRHHHRAHRHRTRPLTLLAGGLTDEAASKRLAISLRTVRRIMADLMTRLDATSRFEAGIKAAKRGWL